MDVCCEDIEVGIKRERLGDFEVAFGLESFVLIPGRPSIGLVGLSFSVSNIRFSESKEPVTRNIAQQDVFCQEKLLFALDKLRLTTRPRLAFVHLCDATCALDCKFTHATKILKRTNRFVDQSVISCAQKARVLKNDSAQGEHSNAIHSCACKPSHPQGTRKIAGIAVLRTLKTQNLTKAGG